LFEYCAIAPKVDRRLIPRFRTMHFLVRYCADRTCSSNCNGLLFKIKRIKAWR